MEATQGVWSVLIAAAAVAVPAVLGYFYFTAQRNLEKKTVTTALDSDIRRLKDVLDGRLKWMDKPQSHKLPFAPFYTALYDSHLNKIGMLEPSFAKWVVRFYGQLHFVNDLQKLQPQYYQVQGGKDHFFHTYRNAINKALGFIQLQ